MFEFPPAYIVYVNYAIILLFLIVLYRGYKRGLLLQLIDLVSTLAALFIAWIFSDVFMSLYAFVEVNHSGIGSIDNFISANANRLIWFALLFVLIRVGLLILTPIASAISKMPLVKQVNSTIGGIFSVVVFLFYVIIINYILSLPLITNGRHIIDQTFLGTIQKAITPVVSVLDEALSENEVVQALVQDKALSVEQKQAVIAFLSDHGFSSQDIEEFLSRYE